MNYTIECEQEVDGRWLAEVIELPGVLTYGATKNEAIVKAETLALRVIAERLEQGEANPTSIHIAPQQRHESMAFKKGQAGSRGWPNTQGLNRKTCNRGLVRSWLAGAQSRLTSEVLCAMQSLLKKQKEITRRMRLICPGAWLPGQPS
jgi:predicted RNase H-like HicB family nuclease